MKITNEEIYYSAQVLKDFFETYTEYLPAKIIFYIQKNIQTLLGAAQEIEIARHKIGQQYGVLNESENKYNIPEENIEKVNQEILDLLSIEQDLNLYSFKLEDLDNLKFTPKQMQAIGFMIEG